MAGLLGAPPGPPQVTIPPIKPVPPSPLGASVVSEFPGYLPSSAKSCCSVVPTLSSSPSAEGFASSGSHEASDDAPVDNPSGFNPPSSPPRSFVSSTHLRRTHSSPFWADVVQRKDSEGSCGLKFFPPLAVDGDTSTISPPPAEVIDQGRRLWGSTLVGYFVDTPPHPLAVCAIVRILWMRFCLEHVASNDVGSFFFRFSSLKKMEQCLLAGPWMIAGKAIFLKQLLPGMQLCKDMHKSFTIWINLYNVPVEYWSPVGLGWVGSAIGKPIQLCPRTAKTNSIDVARICVEIDADSSFPTRVVLKSNSDPSSNSAPEFVVNVGYSWKPTRCGRCLLIGHEESKCNSKRTISSAGKALKKRVVHLNRSLQNGSP